jgi:hypothetical protein
MLPVLAAVGCTASAEEVRPPPDQLAFPTGMAVSPDEHSLFVVNANSELRFDSGSIGVLDLDLIETVIASWSGGTIPSGFDCMQDLGHTETLQCDEKRPKATRACGSATCHRSDGAGTPAAPAPPNLLRVRSDPRRSVGRAADYDGEPALQRQLGSYPLCDDAHR